MVAICRTGYQAHLQCMIAVRRTPVRHPILIGSTTVLVPTGTAAPCRRRESPVLDAQGTGGEWDVCHDT